ncbi:hypothetical protein [Nocardia sp. alder85J]|uniref:hypothetical protein n=1 Tax=Nocardia sp. alder85J TaxID=2862949 RepID=UPI001CD4821D|nr:hypothetical protein [Nocardia sp. alder85J]MCX4098931.1 hypothetical protein [Nocardia sp. alder85J]
MIGFIAAVVVVALFAWIVHRCAPKPGERASVLLERYRPHAPMADWSMPPDQYDRIRQYAELQAMRAHQSQSSSTQLDRSM